MQEKIEIFLVIDDCRLAIRFRRWDMED